MQSVPWVVLLYETEGIVTDYTATERQCSTLMLERYSCYHVSNMSPPVNSKEEFITSF